MYGLPFALPHTVEWIREKLDLRALAELRRQLRSLERLSDARLVVLWAAENAAKTGVLTTIGDDEVLPPELPDLLVSVPSRETVRDRHRERHAAVVLKIRLGGHAPTLGLMVVAPGNDPGPPLLDALEVVAEAIEIVIVEAAERAEARAATPSQRGRVRRTDAEAR